MLHLDLRRGKLHYSLDSGEEKLLICWRENGRNEPRGRKTAVAVMQIRTVIGFLFLHMLSLEALSPKD